MSYLNIKSFRGESFFIIVLFPKLEISDSEVWKTAFKRKRVKVFSWQQANIFFKGGQISSDVTQVKRPIHTNSDSF